MQHKMQTNITSVIIFIFFREKKPQTNIKDNICIQNLDRIFFIFVEEVLLLFLYYISIYHVFGLNQTRNNIILTPQKSKSYLSIVVFDKFLWQVTNFDLSDMRQVQKQMNDVDEYSKWHLESLMLAYKSR